MYKRSKWKRTVKTVLWIGTGILLAAVILAFVNWPTFNVVHQWERPASPGDGGHPCTVSVVETDLDFRDFPFAVARNHSIRVGPKPFPDGRPTRAHWIKYSFHLALDYGDLGEFLDDAEVQWTDEGVELALPSGHRLFIPGRMFASSF